MWQHDYSDKKSTDELVDDVSIELERLEFRLHEFHEHLLESIAARDRLAIDAAWGVAGSLHSLIAVGILYLAWDRWLGWSTGSAAGFGVASLIVWVASQMWVNHQRMKEVDRFARLPDWK